MTLTTALILVGFITIGCGVCWVISMSFWLVRTLDLHIFSFIGMTQQQILQELMRTYDELQASVLARLITYMRMKYREEPETFGDDGDPEIWKDLERTDAVIERCAFDTERRWSYSWRGIRFTKLERITVDIAAEGSEGLVLHWDLDDLSPELRKDFLNLWHLNRFMIRDGKGNGQAAEGQKSS